MNLVDMTGQKYGRLTVLERDGSQKIRGDNSGITKSLATWRCRCDCGTECIVIGANLRSGQTRSCGCLRVENMREIAARTKGKGKKRAMEANECQKNQG